MRNLWQRKGNDEHFMLAVTLCVGNISAATLMYTRMKCWKLSPSLSFAITRWMELHCAQTELILTFQSLAVVDKATFEIASCPCAQTLLRLIFPQPTPLHCIYRINSSNLSISWRKQFVWVAYISVNTYNIDENKDPTSGWASIMTDLWSVNQTNESFMDITAHWIEIDAMTHIWSLLDLFLLSVLF